VLRVLRVLLLQERRAWRPLRVLLPRLRRAWRLLQVLRLLRVLLLRAWRLPWERRLSWRLP
jgi:hypothetical protein